MSGKGNVSGWMEILDDYGKHKYIVNRVEDECYYFRETTLPDNHKLRYNGKSGVVEEYTPERGEWEVYSQYIYQADYLPKA